MKRARSSWVVVLGVAVVAVAAQGAGCSGGGHGGTPSPTPGPTPHLISVTPDTAMAGTTVVLAGSNLGDGSAGNAVLFGSAAAADVISWSATSITVSVPAGSPGGDTTVEVAVGATHSNPLPFTMPLPRAIYVALEEQNTNRPFYLAGFAVATSGALTPLAGSPYAPGVNAALFSGDSNNVKVNLHAKRVFASSKTSLLAWDIDPFTGALTSAPGSPLLLSTTGFFFSVDVSHDGDRVYVVDEVNPDIWGVASSPAALSVLPASPFLAGRGSLDVAKLTPDGRRLYVNSEQSSPYSIVGYAVASDGTLADLAGSPFALPNYGFDMEMHPSGAFLYHATFNDGAITRMDINPSTGVLTTGGQVTASVGPGLRCTPDGTRLYAPRYGVGDLYGYGVGPGGALTALPGSPWTIAPQRGSAVDVDAANRWLFMPEKDVSKMHVYALTTAGAPVEITGSPFVLDTNGLGGSALDTSF